MDQSEIWLLDSVKVSPKPCKYVNIYVVDGKSCSALSCLFSSSINSMSVKLVSSISDVWGGCGGGSEGAAINREQFTSPRRQMSHRSCE